MSTHSCVKSSATAQAFQAPAVGQAVGNEVHAPHLVDAGRHFQGHALVGYSALFLALAHRQLCLAVEPIHPLVIHRGELDTQQVMDAAIAEATPHMRDLHDLGAELLRCFVHRRRVPIAVPREPHQAARAAFRESMLFNHLRHRRAPDLRG